VEFLMTLAHIEAPAGLNLSQQRAAEIQYIAANPNVFAIRPETCEEAADLLAEGVDVSVVDVYDPHALPPIAQEIVDDHIAKLEVSENGAEQFIEPPAMSVWTDLRKRAHALQPLYTPDAATLGGPINSEAYDRPLFRISIIGADGMPTIAMMSAAQVIRAEFSARERPDKAEGIITAHQRFASTPIDDISRLFYQGSMDGRAIRSRAYRATGMALEHFSDEDGGIYRDGLRCASFACGAAGPVSLLVDEMQRRGAQFDKVYFLDKDPMALAGAYETAHAAGITENDVVEILLCDLLKDDFTKDIESGTLDVADLLGLVEYLPDKYAIGLLAKVKTLMKPGGIILWANMLDHRPQQVMFKKVVKWPPLQQRSITQSLDLMGKAGFALDDISVSISARDGVYANYAIQIPARANTPLRVGALAAAA
jgi:SAM-dependent methyltransferase